MNLGAVPAPQAQAHAPGREAVQQRFITFFLDGRSYGLPLQHVAEICPFRELNKLPHMPRAVEGILDLRGQVVPVVNLRTRMSLPPLDPSKTGTILVLDLPGQPTGLLVDAVDAVLAVSEEDLVPASPVLAGAEGAVAQGFIVRGEQVVTLLDAMLVASQNPGRARRGPGLLADLDLEERMDESLRKLIALAPPKGEEKHQVLPQIESSISYTEQEMAKVLDRVEAMLAGADRIFEGLSRLKKEAGTGHLKGHEKSLADLERLNQDLQDTVFMLIQQVQFQDIARQKLERVMAHLRGMQGAIAGKFRNASTD